MTKIYLIFLGKPQCTLDVSGTHTHINLIIMIFEVMKPQCIHYANARRGSLYYVPTEHFTISGLQNLPIQDICLVQKQRSIDFKL